MKRIIVLCTLLLTQVGGLCAATTELNWISHWKDEGLRETLIHEVKKEYEFLYPDVNVNMVFNKDLIADGANYKWKVAHTIVDMIESGKIEYDVVFLGVAVYNHVAEILKDPDWGTKHLVDFSQVNGFVDSQKEFIKKTSHYKEQTGGIFVGPFIEGFFACPWYSKIIARKTGISVKEREVDITTFISYAKKLHEFNRNNGTSIPFISMCSFNRIESLFEYIFRSYFKDPQQAINQIYDNEKREAFLQSLLVFEELSKYQPIFNEGWKKLPWKQWEKQFLDGSSLFIITGTYMYNSLFALDPEKARNVVPIQPPHVNKANGMVGDFMNVFAVMKNSPNKENGIKLLNLWSEPKISEKWVNYTKNPTGIKGHLWRTINDHGSKDPYENFISNMSSKFGNLPVRNFRKPTYIFGPKCQITANDFRMKLTQILEGTLSAHEYYNSTVKTMNEYLKNTSFSMTQGFKSR